MIWTHRGKDIPLEVYHGVPKGWYKSEILAEHARLGGTYDIGGPEATEPGAPDWLPERNAWLQYRETLYRIAKGVKARDLACIEIAIRFIELRHIGSYSGFVRSKLCLRLKQAPLSPQHESRLHRHFSQLAMSGEHTVEFEDYFKLWRRFITEDQKRELLAQVASRGEHAVKWLVENLQPHKAQ